MRHVSVSGDNFQSRHRLFIPHNLRQARGPILFHPDVSHNHQYHGKCIFCCFTNDVSANVINESVAAADAPTSRGFVIQHLRGRCKDFSQTLLTDKQARFISKQLHGPAASL